MSQDANAAQTRNPQETEQEVVEIEGEAKAGDKKKAKPKTNRMDEEIKIKIPRADGSNETYTTTRRKMEEEDRMVSESGVRANSGAKRAYGWPTEDSW